MTRTKIATATIYMDEFRRQFETFQKRARDAHARGEQAVAKYWARQVLRVAENMDRLEAAAPSTTQTDAFKAFFAI